MSLIRRRIKSPLLRFELIKAGTISDIELAIVYIEGKTPERLREEVKKRLKAIKLELVLTSGSIMPLCFGGQRLVLFRSVHNSASGCPRREDKRGQTCGADRRRAVRVVFPTLFTENFQSVDDYEEKPYYATFQRWVRYLAFFIAAFLPGVYVASATFHSEALSRQLLLSLIASEESTPLPLVTEMIMVIIMFEILREAGLRLPRAVGGAVSIVGGLVIGDAAVTSGLISAPLLIIIGITATSSFVVPGLNPQVTILRLLGVILGGMAGYFGIAVLIVVTLVNAGATDGFGVPYTAPLFPFTLRAMRDVATRVGFRRMQERTASIEKLNGSGGEMQNSHKISSLQLFILLLLARVMHTMIYYHGDEGVGLWMMPPVLAVTAIEAVIAIPVVKLANSGESVTSALGSRLGKAAAICYSAFFIYILSGTMSYFAEFMHSEFWRVGAPAVVILILCAAAGYCAYLGIEPVARAASVVAVAFFTLFIAMALVSEAGFDSLNFEPLRNLTLRTC